MNEKNLKILKIQREKTSVHIYIYTYDVLQLLKPDLTKQCNENWDLLRWQDLGSYFYIYDKFS